MTCREKLAIEHPDAVGDPSFVGGCKGCPSCYGYMPDADWCHKGDLYKTQEERCTACWDREIPEETVEKWNHIREMHGLTPIAPDDCGPADQAKILDSGERREFETGAVRDIQEGKGRCDLMPLDVVADYLDRGGKPDMVLLYIFMFQQVNRLNYLELAIDEFNKLSWKNNETMFLEVSKHFEEGAKKYGEHNWQKGIPVHCYIDSAVRHYLKFMRGDKDEPHDRAFVWNLMCCIWTCKHKPELNEYLKTE